MKLFDKIKDLFLEDVEDDEDIELEEENKELYEEPKNVLPKVMREDIKLEETNDLKSFSKEPIKENIIEDTKKVEENTKKFSFPINFDEEVPSRNNRNTGNVNVLNLEKTKEKHDEAGKVKETIRKVSELYPEKTVVKEKPKFKASPVISPVYGVLDKNYTKEEVKEKSEDLAEMKRPSKKVDFEAVRKKAFGNLADEIKDNLMCENCELYKEVKRISSLKEGDLLYDMTVDDEVPKDVTIEKAYDNYEEFGVAYEPDKKILKEENEIQKIDDTNKDELEEIPSRNKNIEEKKEEETNKSSKVDADFFALIDSMYKERTDD